VLLAAPPAEPPTAPNHPDHDGEILLKRCLLLSGRYLKVKERAQKL
jgi:hypothetical protein